MFCDHKQNNKNIKQSGVNLPGARADIPFMSDRDKKDLTFGVENEVDMIAASFTRSPQDVRDMRNFMGEKGKKIQIISKIESMMDDGSFFMQFVRETLTFSFLKNIFCDHVCCTFLYFSITDQEGLDYFDEILDIADGIMVARGDLGVEIPIQKVCLVRNPYFPFSLACLLACFLAFLFSLSLFFFFLLFKIDKLT